MLTSKHIYLTGILVTFLDQNTQWKGFFLYKGLTNVKCRYAQQTVVFIYKVEKLTFQDCKRGKFSPFIREILFHPNISLIVYIHKYINDMLPIWIGFQKVYPYINILLYLCVDGTFLFLLNVLLYLLYLTI